ncbi:type I-G CRISPR-associated protein Csb2 [Deferrisoma sp.]
MTRHLCISVTLLDPLFHGKGDDGEPEWPPSPMRLFQALLAGARTGCRGARWEESRAAAFRWLERQGPPLIVAPEARQATEYTFFVPNNDSDAVFERQERLTSKVAHPHRLIEGNTIYYVWRIDNASHAEAICREARHIVALGWGIDQAIGDGWILSGDEVARLPGQRWRPWRAAGSGGRVWRIPRQGSLEDLEQCYESFAKRIDRGTYHPPRKPRQFDTVLYLTGTTMPPRHYAAFELPAGVAFRQEAASEVAAMLRSLACACAKADTHEFPGGSATYVAGHVTEKNGATPPRFSYLPLPSIGHEHADGLIRRLLLAEPYGGDGSHARWARARLPNQVLRDNAGNERGVLLDLRSSTSKAMLDRYVGEGRDWSTVTPVFPPGFDDGKHGKAEKLLLKAITQAGYPLDALAELTLRKAPFWPGSQHPRLYRRPHYLRHLPGWHVRLGFREPIPGPVALGAGRHCGLGVFARTEGTR